MHNFISCLLVQNYFLFKMHLFYFIFVVGIICNLNDLFHVGRVDHDARVHAVSNICNVEIGASLHKIFGIDHQLEKRSGKFSCTFWDPHYIIILR